MSDVLTTLASYTHSWRCDQTAFAEEGVSCVAVIEIVYPELVVRTPAAHDGDDYVAALDRAREAATYVVRHGDARAAFRYNELTADTALGAWIRLLHRGHGHGRSEVGVVAASAPLPGH